MLISESLEQFLGEWIDRSEDRWADREIDRWEKRKAGLVLEEDPKEILTDPDVEYPYIKNIEKKRKILLDIINYKKGHEVTPEEFKNFCIWATKVAMSAQEAVALVSIFAENNSSIANTLEKEKAPDGGSYREGFEVLRDKFKPDQGYDEDIG